MKIKTYLFQNYVAHFLYHNSRLQPGSNESWENWSLAARLLDMKFRLETNVYLNVIWFVCNNAGKMNWRAVFGSGEKSGKYTDILQMFEESFKLVF